MRVNESTNENSFEFWLNEPLKKKNVFEFFEFLGKEYPNNAAELKIIEKKLKRKSITVLSLLITFQRTIEDDNLKVLIKKLIQTLMDNPKGFK